MKIRRQPIVVVASILLASGLYIMLRSSTPDPTGLAGSEVCRKCHPTSHELWKTSLHGRSLQPYSPSFATAHLATPTGEIHTDQPGVHIEVEPEKGIMVLHGDQGVERLPISHAVGGKNVFYFLTRLARGRLQSLPVAYDIRHREWFGTTGSAVRHFSNDTSDAPLPWRHRAYTFSTSCYRCHVSQASTTYDVGTDAYELTWAEPGINCEACHGPAGEHVRVCLEAEGNPPAADLKIISTKNFDADQTNALCGSCHAKMAPLTLTFSPGEQYADHFDLATLEDPDFHPDGRDRGENYTYTTWRLSPCVQAPSTSRGGTLSCLHCHTSSGRFRFESDPNRSCLPCHEERVRNVAVHSHHPVESAGSQCIQCHLPATEFARMRRTDHSMLPPTPAATIAFGSPNACSTCHADKSPEWADRHARKWHGNDYQGKAMHRAGLVHAARRGDWSRLDEMLEEVSGNDRDEILATSLLRLLRSCTDKRKWPGIIKALKDPSPLVRASAAAALEGNRSADVVLELAAATRDKSRLVRIRAAAALAGVGPGVLSDPRQGDVGRAAAEYTASLQVRSDDHTSYFNLGNFHLARGEHAQALASYGTALTLEPRHAATLVNASLASNALGSNREAERFLREALTIEPANAAVHLNLGLLLGESGRAVEAEAAFRSALTADTLCDPAAYNLAVIVSTNRLQEAVEWSRKAVAMKPDEPKYVFALVHYLRQAGQGAEAIQPLKELLDSSPSEADAYGMLGEVLEEIGRRNAAIKVYREGAQNAALPVQARAAFAERLHALSGTGP